MNVALTINATTASEVTVLSGVLAHLSGLWPAANNGQPVAPCIPAAIPQAVTSTAPVALNAPAPVPASPAPAAVAEPQGEQQGSADTTTGPMRGKNAETHASQILEALRTAETVEALDFRLAGAAATIARLPEKWVKEINSTAAEVRNALTVPVTITPATPAAPARNAADAAGALEAITGQPAPATPAAATATDPAANDIVVFYGDGTKRAGFSHSAHAVKVLKDTLDEATTDEEVDAILDANTKAFERLSAEEYTDVEHHANNHRQKIMFGMVTTKPQADEVPAVVTVDDCRAALESCIAESDFPSAAARMKKLGYAKLSDIPDDNAARAEFVEVVKHGMAPRAAR